MTWIDRRLQDGAAGLQEIREHVMATYAWPLKVYYLGSSYRNLGDADDMINGFLADRMVRPDFFHKWSESGLRMRRWLANGLLFFLREEIARRKRDTHAPLEQRANGRGEGERAGNVVDELALTGNPDIDIERAAAVAFVQRALISSQQKCESQNLTTHWNAFLEYHLHERSIQQIAENVGESTARAAVMIRTARRHFRNALRETLMQDGVTEQDVDAEIQTLLAVTS